VALSHRPRDSPVPSTSELVGPRYNTSYLCDLSCSVRMVKFSLSVNGVTCIFLSLGSSPFPIEYVAVFTNLYDGIVITATLCKCGGVLRLCMEKRATFLAIEYMKVVSVTFGSWSFHAGKRYIQE
jgi:hypothetical protein